MSGENAGFHFLWFAHDPSPPLGVTIPRYGSQSLRFRLRETRFRFVYTKQVYVYTETFSVYWSSPRAASVHENMAVAYTKRRSP